MNHCRKVILLWIVMVIGLTLSCRKVTEDAVKTPEIEWMEEYDALHVKYMKEGGLIH